MRNIDAVYGVESTAITLYRRDYSASHKEPRKLVNFSEMTGETIPSYRCETRPRILFLRCAPDTTPCLYSQWSDFVNRGRCNFRRQYVWICVCARVYPHYYGFCELSGSANLSGVTTYLFDLYFFLSKVIFRHGSYHMTKFHSYILNRWGINEKI